MWESRSLREHRSSSENLTATLFILVNVSKFHPPHLFGLSGLSGFSHRVLCPDSPSLCRSFKIVSHLNDLYGLNQLFYKTLSHGSPTSAPWILVISSWHISTWDSQKPSTLVYIEKFRCLPNDYMELLYQESWKKCEFGTQRSIRMESTNFGELSAWRWQLKCESVYDYQRRKWCVRRVKDQKEPGVAYIKG